MVFRKKFKFNLPKKHNKEDPNCKCRECEKKRKAEKQELDQIRKDAEIKQDNPPQMKPEEGKIDYAAVAFNDSLAPVSGSTGERTGDGLILQRNVVDPNSLPTPEEVIAKSGSKGMNEQQKINISEMNKDKKVFKW